MLESLLSRRSTVRFATFALFAGVAACGTAGQGPGAAEGPAKEPGEVVEPTAQAVAVADLGLAQELATYGQRTNNALALATAAQILINTPRADLDVQPETVAGEAGEAGTKADQAPRPDARELLAQARQAAAGNAELLQMVERLEARLQTAQRGAVGGAKEGVHRVQARSTDIFRISFRANETAAVYVSGDGDTDLDLYVYDENGNLIDSDTGYSDEALVEWVPRWTGQFRIEVRNLGNVWNEYYIATN